MAWVVDTCLALDILDADPQFARTSSRLLDHRGADGLVLCPISIIELAPAFLGNPALEEQFLRKVGIQYQVAWEWQDTLAAHAGWQRHIELKRSRKTRKRPLADIQIGAFALRYQGLLTRNSADFSPFFPKLTILTPASR